MHAVCLRGWQSARHCVAFCVFYHRPQTATVLSPGAVSVCGFISTAFINCTMASELQWFMVIAGSFSQTTKESFSRRTVVFFFGCENTFFSPIQHRDLSRAAARVIAIDVANYHFNSKQLILVQLPPRKLFILFSSSAARERASHSEQRHIEPMSRTKIPFAYIFFFCHKRFEMQMSFLFYIFFLFISSGLTIYGNKNHRKKKNARVCDGGDAEDIDQQWAAKL